MKKLERIKTIELIIFILLAVICFYLIVMKSNVYHLITDSKELQLVCALLWISLFIGFIFVFIDLSLYSKQKSTMNALDYAAHSDALTKIANRQGIDEVIEKYFDIPLPENLGCAFFLLSSLKDINPHSKALGNEQIKSFSTILKLASTGVCFVGRNGGNVFLAIFEDTTQEKIDSFMERIHDKVSEYNYNEDVPPMYYQCGVAFHEDESVGDINALISLSSKRTREANPIPSCIRTIDTFVSEKLNVTDETINEEAYAPEINEEEIAEIDDYRYSFEELDEYNDNYVDYFKN